MIDLNLYTIYVDWTFTQKANDVAQYQYLNNFVSEELTLEMIKRFRTMVAETLLACSASWDDEYDEVNTPKIISMLEYYKNNMTDCAIKGLLTFSDPSINLHGSYTDCGCGSKSSTLSQLGAMNPTTMLSSFTKTCNCGNDAIAALFATVSYLFYYKAISQIGASKSMALNITYSAWAVIFGVIFMKNHSLLNPVTILCTIAVLVFAILAGADYKELFKKEKKEEESKEAL
jgi:hypothetical protein